MSKSIVAAAGKPSIIRRLVPARCSVSSSSESSSTLETSVTDEQGNTTTTKTTTDSDGNTTTETTKTLSIGDWVDEWMGKTDKGYEVYYAQAPDATEAFLVLHSESVGDKDFIGESEAPPRRVW